MSNRRFTIAEFRLLVSGLTSWAEAVRSRYFNIDCYVCGVQYHPRMGPPPEEKSGEEFEMCGHAHFREMASGWDGKRQCWIDDDDDPTSSGE